MSRKKHFPETPSVHVVHGQPETVADLLNKYGTYEIQPTADSDNEFPAIAQGESEK